MRASLTKLSTSLADLESTEEVTPTLLDNVKSLADKLKTLKQDFKNHQLAIIDRTDEEEELAEEQQALDDNDDTVSAMNIRIQRLLSRATPTRIPDSVRVAGRQLTLLQTELGSLRDTVTGLEDSEEGIECTLEEYKERMVEIKEEPDIKDPDR